MSDYNDYSSRNRNYNQDRDYDTDQDNERNRWRNEDRSYNRDSENEGNWNRGYGGRNQGMNQGRYNYGSQGYGNQGSSRGYPNDMESDYDTGSGNSGQRRDWDYDQDYGYGQYGQGREQGNMGRGRRGRRGRMGGYGQGYSGQSDYDSEMGGGNQDWTQEGPHSGRGPRGYQRSPERIREDINERLTRHGWIDPTEIDVQVNGDEVTLAGTVSTRREKRLAENIAERVSGVRDVNNQIRVRREEDDPQGGMNRQGSSRSTGTSDRETSNTGTNGMAQGTPNKGRQSGSRSSST